MKNNISFAEDS